MSSALDKLKSKSSNAAAKKEKVTAFNPFGGNTETRKPAIQILRENFGIGITNYDRGADVWDEFRLNEAGKREPGWVHVAEESLECVVTFSVNEGKGTGRQVIPVNEFVQYVDTLQGIIDSGYEEPPSADRTEYVPTYAVARESFKLVRPKKTEIDADGKQKSVVDSEAARDVVSVRSTSGKGAKPMTVSQAEFPGIVAMLTEIADNLETYTAQAWAGYKAKVGDADETETEDGSDDSDDSDDSDETESDSDAE